MIKQREPIFVIKWSPLQETRISEGNCPICGIHHTRRYICCSKECSDVMRKENIFLWDSTKYKVLKRDNWTCAKCGWQSESKKSNNHGLVVDHIVPIAIGGEQWDLNNLQLLCTKCNKEKTKADMGVIAKHRCKDKQEVLNV